MTKLKSEEIEVTGKFKEAFDIMEHTKKNIYITGRAGTGKSTLLKYFCENTSKNIVVLAPTGVAAINVQGTTIHSFFQFPFGIIEGQDVEKLSKKKEIFKTLDAIIIDEISMVRADMMNAIDHSLRKNTGNHDKPFGGVQLILFGDLYQLAPVVSRGQEAEYLKDVYGGVYFFNALSFNTISMEKVELIKNFRQKSDEKFEKLLNKMRENSLIKNDFDELNARIGVYDEKKGPAITLATTNKIVSKINDEKLKGIKKQEHTFKAGVDTGFDNKKAPVDIKLKLKEGAQIMMVKNDNQHPRRWANGTLGTIIELSKNNIKVKIDNNTYKIDKAVWEDFDYEYNSEDGSIAKYSKGAFSQYPIKLAWAVTIHKSQGKTFDRIIIDLGWGAFAHGQTYVAFSRCTTLKEISLKKAVKASDIIVDKVIIDFHNQ